MTLARGQIVDLHTSDATAGGSPLAALVTAVNADGSAELTCFAPNRAVYFASKVFADSETQKPTANFVFYTAPNAEPAFAPPPPEVQHAPPAPSGPTDEVLPAN